MNHPSSGSAAIVNPVAALRQYGQSVWLYFIRRSLIAGGELKRLVDEDGLGGVTSNPAIFEKAIDGSEDYAPAIQEISDLQPGLGAKAVYERLAIKDIQDAADVLRPRLERQRVEREQRGAVPGAEEGERAGRAAPVRGRRPRVRDAARGQAARHLAEAVRGVAAVRRLAEPQDEVTGFRAL